MKDNPFICHGLGCSLSFSDETSLNKHLRVKHNTIDDQIVDNSDIVVIKKRRKRLNKRLIKEEVNAQNNIVINGENNIIEVIDEVLFENKQNSSIETISENLENGFICDLNFVKVLF